MAIDARIRAVGERGRDLVLDLEAYTHENGAQSIPGQKQLLIRNYTRRPAPGWLIWGGADRCVIEVPGGAWHYRREGATTLHELADKIVRPLLYPGKADEW